MKLFTFNEVWLGRFCITNDSHDKPSILSFSSSFVYNYEFLKFKNLKFSFCVLRIRNAHNLLIRKFWESLQMKIDMFIKWSWRGLEKHLEALGMLLTLKCQRVRTATTMAVVDLLLPLEQLKTKAERESSAKAAFMASNSISKSWKATSTNESKLILLGTE